MPNTTMANNGIEVVVKFTGDEKPGLGDSHVIGGQTGVAEEVDTTHQKRLLRKKTALQISVPTATSSSSVEPIYLEIVSEEGETSANVNYNNEEGVCNVVNANNKG